MAKTEKPQGDLAAPLPTSLEAEKAVLGAILLDNAALLPAREVLAPEDFFLPNHVHIFYQMQELADAGTAIDLVTLTDALGRVGDLEAAGGAPYLASLADGMPRVSNTAHYAGIVKEKAILRAVIHTAAKLQMSASEAANSSEILDEAKNKLNEIQNLRPTAGLVSMKVVVRDSFENLEKTMQDSRTVTGIATGYIELDNLLSGFQPSELIVLAARPSHGKTALALNIAENIAIRKNGAVAMFSLEMSKESVLKRLLAAVAQIDAHKFRTGHLLKSDWSRMTEALGAISSAPFWIDDASTSTIAQIAARAERCHKAHPLSLVVVDYLQLVTGGGSGNRRENRQEEVAGISRGLKALAKDLGVPVLALSQLKRTDEERTPQLSDLRESGAIEQDADVVMFIYRPNLHNLGAAPEERDEAEILVAKQRNGPTDRVRFVFRSKITRFEERAPEMFARNT